MKIHGHLIGENDCWEITMESGVVTRMEKTDGTFCHLWITPGLFDIQVNGYKGIDLTSDRLRTEDVAALEQQMLANGITRWCPTVITAAPEVMHHSLKTIRQAETLGLLRHMHCIHLEGPYLSPEIGYRGIHPLEFIHDPDRGEFESFQESAGGRIGYVTLAPERQGAMDFISYLAKASIRVGLGHFNADEKIIQHAVNAGASISTHLFNGCVSMTNRHSNVIYSQLSQDALWASFIPDGHHIPYSTLRVGLRSKGQYHSIFTSDTISYGGLSEGVYTDAYGRRVVVKNGGLWLEEGEYLYGAWRNLMQGILQCVQHKILDIKSALLLASKNPSIFFGIDKEFKVKVGCKMPLLIIDADDLTFRVIS